jgi:acetylornithine deacetylase
MKLQSLCSLAFYALASGSFSQHSQLSLIEDERNDDASLLDLHRHLVEIPSITGSEHNVSLYLRDYLQDRGFTVELQPVDEGRENVLAYLGETRKTRTLVTSHVDTVPPFIPYERRGDQIWGRGSADAKGSVAAQIIAVQRLREAQQISEGDLALLFVVGEERDGHGMNAANNLGLTWESVIFGEPTELKLATGHKGGLAFTVSAKGKAGHSGYPELGRSAIDILVHGLSVLHQLELPGSERFGNTTLNVGQIEGGVALNVIAQNASATVLVRVASEDLGEIKSRIEKAVLAASPWLEVDFLSYGIRPVQIDSDIDGTSISFALVGGGVLMVTFRFRKDRRQLWY